MRKILIASDPLSTLWGEDLYQDYYILYSQFICTIAHTFEADTFVTCSSCGELHPLLELSIRDFTINLNHPVYLEKRKPEDSFDDIDIILLLMHDDMESCADTVRPLMDRIPNSPHLRERAVILYKYHWQMEYARVMMQQEKNDFFATIMAQFQVAQHNREHNTLLDVGEDK